MAIEVLCLADDVRSVETGQTASSSDPASVTFRDKSISWVIGRAYSM